MSRTAFINEFSVEALRDVLQKLEVFPNFKVNGLTAHQLEEIRGLDQSLFAQISEHIKSGKWFPLVGVWTNCDKADEYALIRNALYSVDYFKTNFGIKSRVFFADKIYNNNFAQILYRSGFDAAYIPEEGESFWLDCADESRVLVYSAKSLDIADANDLDDDSIADCEFSSVEQEILRALDGHLELQSKFQNAEITEPTEAEKLLVEAEKISVAAGEDERAQIREAWLDLFGGEEKTAKETAQKIIGGREFDTDFIRIDSDEVELEEIKLAEDGSGDTVVRVREKCGSEKTLFVVADKLGAGFRCEIIPHEIQTFRINSQGYVTETQINEIM